LARKKSPHLTEAELRLMDVIWDKGSATVSEVASRMLDSHVHRLLVTREDRPVGIITGQTTEASANKQLRALSARLRADPRVLWVQPLADEGIPADPRAPDAADQRAPDAREH